MKRNYQQVPMKELERKFFRYCMTQLNYADNPAYMRFRCNKTMRDIANEFAEKHNVKYKQLMYYLDKWSMNDFYEWGTSIDLGWFDMRNYDSWMNPRYRELIPERTETLLSEAIRTPERFKKWSDPVPTIPILEDILNNTPTNTILKALGSIGDLAIMNTEDIKNE